MAKKKIDKFIYRTLEQVNRPYRLPALPNWVINPFPLDGRTVKVVSSEKGFDKLRDVNTGEVMRISRHHLVNKLKESGMYMDYIT